MATRINRIIALGVFVAAASASPLMAQGKGKGHDKSGKQDGHDKDRVVVVGANGDVRNVPPGLAKKPGGMPPGQYKKRYLAHDGIVVMQQILPARGYTVVRTVPSGESQIIYYRGGDGIVRRSVVSPGTTRLSFTNVPAAILQEIMARLY